MKIGIVSTMHWSQNLRPNGKEYILNFIESIIQNLKCEYTIYIVDNESEFSLDFSKYRNLKYIRIDDQSIEGITGAWNRGIYNAYLDGCDIIINSNDDLTINKTLNDFIQHIIEDTKNVDNIYGPLTNGQLGGPQLSDKPGKGVSYVEHINGFFFAMTKQHYEKYRFKDDAYFDLNHKNNCNDGKWGGQEGQFVANAHRGLKCKILHFCWIDHKKERGWKKVKGLYEKNKK